MSRVHCPRCGLPCPVRLDPGDGGGDPSLLPILIPPDGWLGDPGDANGGVICGDCATTHEISEWMAQAAFVESDMRYGPDVV